MRVDTKTPGSEPGVGTAGTVVAGTPIVPHDGFEGKPEGFLTALFGDLPSGSFAYLWTLPDRRTYWFTDPADAARFVAGKCNGSDVYCGIACADRAGDGGQRVLAEPDPEKPGGILAAGLVAVVADVDFAGPGHTDRKRYPPTLDAALAVVRALPLPPTFTVNSGGGLHLWWLLREAWVFDDGDERAEAQTLLRGWGAVVQATAAPQGYEVDSVHDLARVLRVPGTVNCKDPETAKWSPNLAHRRDVTLLEGDPDRRFNPDDFRQFLPDDLDVATLRASPKTKIALGDLALPEGAAEELEGRFADLLQRDKTLRATWERTRKLPKDNSASGYDLALADRLAVKHEWTAAEVAWAVQHSRREHQGDKPLHSTKLQGTVAKAMAAQDTARAKREATDTRATADDLAAETPALQLLTFPRTDAGNGELLASLLGNRLRFDWTRERWLKWGSDLWEPATAGDLTAFAKRAARARYTTASLADDGEQRKWAFASEAKSKVEAALFFARAEAPVTDPGDGWDADPMLLGCPNGVVELATGTFRRGRQGDRLTLKVGVPYDPKAECPRWLQLMSDFFDYDTALQEFVWRAVGYSLTGSIREQVFFLLYGGGSNGKSLFLATLRQVFGHFAYNASFRVFDHACRNEHSQSLAKLEARRFVTASEAAESARLNEDRLKALAGDPVVTANLMYRNDREFANTVKVWLGVNHKPRVLDDSDGFWRKARLVPFTRQFVDPDRIAADPSLAQALNTLPADKDLGQKLQTEAAGILRWAVQGAAMWATDGLREPACVREASARWREEADPLGDFYAERCVIGDGHKVRAGDLFTAYVSCCEDSGVKERERMTQTAFGRRVATRFEKQQRVYIGGVQGPAYFGIGLRQEDDGQVG